MKKTIGQKKAIRQEEAVKNRAPVRAGSDAIDKVMARINEQLGGQGHVFRGGDYHRKDYERRSSGIPSLDYLLNGGLPIGGLIEIGGQFSSGKSTLSLKICAAEQKRQWGVDPAERKAIGWAALEPFSKKYAREVGLFLPYNESTEIDPVTGEEIALDSFSKATPLERLRMQQAGITDPYAELCPVVIVEDERGDVMLDTVLTMLRSNRFSIIVVDSLAMCKMTKWVAEGEVQDASDFPREPKMIGDYTTRALLSLNARYDANGVIAKDGAVANQTTLIHLNQVGSAIGTMAMSPHKKYNIKGGEANKHNHHAIIFLWRDSQLKSIKQGDRYYNYGQTINMICIKSKIGPPFLEGSIDYYFQPFGSFQPGDFDTLADLVVLASIARTIEKAGAWYRYKGINEQGHEKFEEALRNSPPEFLAELLDNTLKALRR